jgi:hypothetical protein
MKSRDNFSSEVINAIKLQSAYICSNPECRKLTVAPALSDKMKVQYFGKIAHINAAAVNGPKYNVRMTVSERKAIGNAIFLCSNCADMIDKNKGDDYPADLLHSWKETHKEWVLANLNKGPQNKTVSVGSKFQSGGITAHIVNLTLSPIQADNDKQFDQKTFKRSMKVFDDDQIHRFCDALLSNGECRYNDMRRLEELLEFYRKPVNRYLNTKVEKLLEAFASKMPALASFVSIKNFDKWPYSQPSTNFTIQLRPELLRDTGYRKREEGDLEKWNNLFLELIKKVKAMKKNYEAFRKMVKSELHV